MAIMWTRIGICTDFQSGERLWHAGLSADGRLCFMATLDDEHYIVWDIGNSEVVWREAGQVKHPDLAEWADENGYLTIEEGRAGGKYRIFGLNVKHAKTKDEATDSVLQVDIEREVVLVVQGSSSQVLKYECFSGDWAFASFSDNGEVIAVIEPYCVSFFGKAASG